MKMKASSRSAMRKTAGGGPFPQLSWFEYSELLDGTPRYTYQFEDYLITIGPDMHGVCGDGGWDWEVSRANMKSDLLEQSWNKCDSLEDAYEDLRRVVFHEDPEHRSNLWFDDMKGMDILFGGRKRAVHDEVLATIESVNPRDARTLYISTDFDSASLCICMSGCDRRLVDWDSRFDIFLWACDMAGFDKNTSIWVDEVEGGVLYNYLDLCEEAHNANRHTRSSNKAKRAWYDKQIATIMDSSIGEERILYRSNGATAPICMSGCDKCLAYWESRLEVFLWACDNAGFDYETSVWLDESSGEVCTYLDLCDEEYDMMYESKCNKRSGKRTKRATSKRAGGFILELGEERVNGETRWVGALCDGDYYVSIYPDHYSGGWESAAFDDNHNEIMFGYGQTVEGAAQNLMDEMENIGINVTAVRKRTKRAYMDRDDILGAIYDLSRSQGFYGRLLADLEDLMEYDPDRYEDVMFELEEQRFNDPVDMVMYFEC